MTKNFFTFYKVSNKCGRFLLSQLIFTFLTITAFSQNASVQSRLEIKLPSEAKSLAYTPDSARIATGQSDGRVSLWDTKTGSLEKTLDTGGKQVETLLFTPKGDRLIAITQDNKTKIWSVADWKELASLEDITPISGISADGQFLVTQDPKHEIVIWELNSLKRLKQIGKTGLDGAVNINFTADGKMIAVSYQHRINLITLDKGKVNELIVRGKPQGMKMEQTGKNTVVLSLGSLDDDSAIVHRVIPSKVGTLLAIGRGWYGKPHFVDVWDFNTKQKIGRYKPQDDGALAQFSFDNSLLAIAGAKSVTVWDVTTEKQIASFKASMAYENTPLAKGTTLFTFSPTSKELAIIDGTNLVIYKLM